MILGSLEEPFLSCRVSAFEALQAAFRGMAKVVIEKFVPTENHAQ